MGIFDFFLSCDLDLDMMIFMYKVDRIAWNYITGCANMNFLRQGFRKLSSERHTDIQTDRIDRNYKARSFTGTQYWIEQGLTSDSTRFKSFRRRWGDCGISQDCSRSQSPQCVRCWVVCARPLLITVVCMCIIVSVCFRCPARTVDFSGTRLYLCIYNQPSYATHLLARWEHERVFSK